MLDGYTTGGVLRPSSFQTITVAVKASGAEVIFTSSLPANKTLRRISRSTGLPIAKTPLYGEGVASGQTAVSTATLNICTMMSTLVPAMDSARACIARACPPPAKRLQ